MELFKAHQQWANRPADERFSTLEELYRVTKGYADIAVQSTVPYKVLRVEAVEDEVKLVGETGSQARLTHWAFGQLAARVGAPGDYLRGLPATLAAQNLNYGLKRRVIDSGNEVDKARLLIHRNGDMMLRAITSTKYQRIWNYEVADRLISLQDRGWEPARPDFNAGPDAAPALYASDHDMFAFIRNRESLIIEPGNPDGLQRGVIVENSEVGASALKLTRFLYRAMCGNHIIWGASKVMEINIRHVGRARNVWNISAIDLQNYANESASDMEGKIIRARQTKIAGTKDELLDIVFGKRAIGLSRKVISEGFDACQPTQDGSPYTVWGLVQGLTRYSQTKPYADQRIAIDKAAGKILEIAF